MIPNSIPSIDSSLTKVPHIAIDGLFDKKLTCFAILFFKEKSPASWRAI